MSTLVILFLKLNDMYKVYDSFGNLMRRFPTKEQAYNYKEAFGNKKWKVR